MEAREMWMVGMGGAAMVNSSWIGGAWCARERVARGRSTLVGGLTVGVVRSALAIEVAVLGVWLRGCVNSRRASEQEVQVRQIPLGDCLERVLSRFQRLPC